MNRVTAIVLAAMLGMAATAGAAIYNGQNTISVETSEAGTTIGTLNDNLPRGR